MLFSKIFNIAYFTEDASRDKKKIQIKEVVMLQLNQIRGKLNKTTNSRMLHPTFPVNGVDMLTN